MGYSVSLALVKDFRQAYPLLQILVEPCCFRNDVSKFASKSQGIILPRTVRLGADTKLGGSWDVCRLTTGLLVQPACVHAWTMNR